MKYHESDLFPHLSASTLVKYTRSLKSVSWEVCNHNSTPYCHCLLSNCLTIMLPTCLPASHLKQLARIIRTMKLLSWCNALKRLSRTTKKALCFQYQMVQAISTSSEQNNANWLGQGRLSVKRLSL